MGLLKKILFGLALLLGVLMFLSYIWGFPNVDTRVWVDNIEISDADGEKVVSVPEGTVDLTISVWDDEDNPLTGVVLSASGCGAQWSNGDDLITTDAENFQTTLTTNFPGSQCEVKITATNPEYEGQATFNLFVNGD
jgi:hypothetical protein